MKTRVEIPTPIERQHQNQNITTIPKRLNFLYIFFSADVDAKLGSTVTIKCNANGHPIPTIKWIREDKQLIKTKDSNSGRIVKFDQTIGPDLVIPNIDTTDMGSYLCIADNGVPPIVSKRIYVYVQCKLVLTR